MKSVRVPAYAKVNLRLDVLGRRADGYHELRTIFQAISLHDTLELQAAREPGIELRIAGNSELAGEPGPDNLVYRAVHQLGREIGLQHGVRAVLTKRRQWFERMTEAYTALWWIPRGTTPSPQDAEDRVRLLRAHGPTRQAFTLKMLFPPPDSPDTTPRPGREDWTCPV